MSFFLKVMWSTGKEWKIFPEDSHIVWFSTESILYNLHYNVGRIHLSGTEYNVGVWFEIEMWQIAVVGQRRRNRYNTVPHICVSVLWTSVFLWRFGDLTRMSYCVRQHCCIYQDFIFWQIRSKIHGVTAIYIKFLHYL